MAKQKLSEAELRQKLSPQQYRVLRQKDTEVPGSGKLLRNKQTGDYACAACGNVVFKSDDKYDSTAPGLIGWPSFSAPASDHQAVKLTADTSLGMNRTEVSCANCGGHLGHLFEADDSPTDKHFCINSVALNFKNNEVSPGKTG